MAAEAIGLALDRLEGRFEEVTAAVSGPRLPENGLVIELARRQCLPEQLDNIPVTLHGTPRKGELIVIRCGDLTLWPASPARPAPDQLETMGLIGRSG